LGTLVATFSAGSRLFSEFTSAQPSDFSNFSVTLYLTGHFNITTDSYCDPDTGNLDCFTSFTVAQIGVGVFWPGIVIPKRRQPNVCINM
jgi:hypothetical protein